MAFFVLIYFVPNWRWTVKNGVRKRVRETVTVAAVKKATYAVTLFTPPEKWRVRVKLGGRVIGFAVPDLQYPETVTVVKVELSNGSVHRVADHSLPTLVPSKEHPNRLQEKCNFYRGMDLPFGCARMSMPQIAELSVGDVVAEDADYAFHWDIIRVETGWRWHRYYWGVKVARYTKMKVLTNNKIDFPKERPYGHEWAYWEDIRFVQGVKAKDWGEMLAALEGKFFSEVNSNERVRCAIEHRRVIARRRDVIDRVVKNGKCFDAGSFDEAAGIEVGIGERLLFIGKKDGKPVWAVDSPAYGHALFLFDNEGPARDFANGIITAAQAKDLAFARIVHSEGWEDRSAKVLERS